MAQVVCVRVTWNGSAPPLPPLWWRDGDYIYRAKFFPIDVHPTIDDPVGRKGYALARAWQTLRGDTDGMLILDGDVIIDPTHLAAMMGCIDSDPGCVWTAPVKIWPVSTHRRDWVWAHWETKASQEIDEHPRWFSFCFTYLPRPLIDAAIRSGLRSWVYPKVDSNVARAAQRMGITARTVPCFPIHTHW